MSAKTYAYTDMWGDVLEVRFLRDTYVNGGNLAVQMLAETDEDGETYVEPYADLTVNVCGYAPAPRCAYIDTNNLGNGIIEFLAESGLAEFAGEFAQSGFCTYPMVRFTDKFFAESAGTVDEVEG